MRRHEHEGQFWWAGHAEHLGRPGQQDDDGHSGERVQVGQQRGIVVGAIGERADGVVGPLMVVLGLQVEAEVGGVREELGVDGKGGIGHEWRFWRGWPAALSQVAVGEGEREAGLVSQDLCAGAGVERSLGPAGPVGSFGREVSHEITWL